MRITGSLGNMLFSDMPRMKKPAGYVLTILAAVFSSLSGIFSDSFAGLIFLALASSVLASALFMFRRAVCFAPAVIAPAAVILFTHSIPSAAFSLLPYTVSLSLSISLYRKCQRSRAVMIASASLGISLSILIFAQYLASPDTLLSFEELRSAAEARIASVTINTPRGRTPLFSSETAAGLSDYIMTSLPAIFICAVSITSYIASLLFELHLRIYSFSELMPDGEWKYRPELTSAVIFIISYVVSAVLVPYRSADIIGYTAENLLLIFLPAMLLYGEISSYKLAVRHDRRILLVIVSLILLFASPSLYLMAVSFFGAGSIIFSRASLFFREHFRHGDDGDGGDDD